MLDECGTDPTIKALLLHGIEEWLNLESKTVEIEPPHDHPHYDALNNSAQHQNQNQIGWDQLLRGRLAKVWGDAYVLWLYYYPTSKPVKCLDPTQWTTNIIKWTWDLVLRP
jgi:hypothetical protein